MKRLLLLGAIICVLGLLYSCHRVTGTSTQEVTKANNVRPVDWEGLYLGPEGEHQQSLKVSVSGDEMTFNYSIVSLSEGNSDYSLSGKAVLKFGDLEWGDDDDGVAYPVDE